MIYFFGDSFTYGYNFLREGKADFKKMIYPYFLSQKLNMPYKNFSYPGGNNWRIGRKIMSLNLTPKDIVIIAWSPAHRFELGVGENHITFLDKVIDAETYDPLYKKQYDLTIEKELSKLFDDSVLNVIIKDDDVYTRQLLPTSPENKIKNHNFRSLHKHFYTHFGTDEWLEEMFLQIFCACIYKLRLSGCKFRVFNTFRVPYERRKNSLLEIPEFIPNPYAEMTEFIRGFKHDCNNPTTYWDITEHEQVANIIYDSLNKGQI